MVNLLMAPQNKAVEIFKIKSERLGGDAQARHLSNLGFVVGAKIEIISENQGNLIVKVKDSKLAIGEEIAKSIYII